VGVVAEIPAGPSKYLWSFAKPCAPNLSGKSEDGCDNLKPLKNEPSEMSGKNMKKRDSWCISIAISILLSGQLAAARIPPQHNSAPQPLSNNSFNCSEPNDPWISGAVDEEVGEAAPDVGGHGIVPASESALKMCKMAKERAQEFCHDRMHALAVGPSVSLQSYHNDAQAALRQLHDFRTRLNNAMADCQAIWSKQNHKCTSAGLGARAGIRAYKAQLAQPGICEKGPPKEPRATANVDTALRYGREGHAIHEKAVKDYQAQIQTLNEQIRGLQAVAGSTADQ